MNIADFFTRSRRDDDEALVSNLSRLGISELEIDDIERLLAGDATKRLIPLSISMGGEKIETKAFLSLIPNPDGARSLIIHTYAGDQSRLQTIAHAKDGVQALLSLFKGDEHKAFAFLRRNRLIDPYLRAYVPKGEHREKGKRVEDNTLDRAFRLAAGSFSRVRGAELSLRQIEELKDGKTVEVNSLRDDKGERYAGFVKLSLTDEQLKMYRDNPGKAVNVRKYAIVTPKKDYKVQVDQNNHGMRTEDNRFSLGHVQSGDSLAQDIKNKPKIKR